MSKPIEKEQLKDVVKTESKAAAENNTCAASKQPPPFHLSSLLSTEHSHALDKTKATAHRHLGNASGNMEYGNENLMLSVIKALSKADQGISQTGKQASKDITQAGISSLVEIAKGSQGGVGDLVNGFIKGGMELERGAIKTTTRIGNSLQQTGAESIIEASANASEAGMGYAKVANNLLNLGIDSSVGYLDNLYGPEGQQVSQDQIPESHQFDEFMTDLAYHGDGDNWEDTELTDEDAARLNANGYDSKTFEVHYFGSGLQIVTVEPKEGSGVNPYVAVRGSELNANMGADWGSDLEKEQVGNRQFENNEAEIAKLLEKLTKDKYTGQVNMGGHSLGGGLAQRITANHPELVNSLTTFQAPGQSTEDVEMFKNKIASLEKVPEINHHFPLDGTVYKTGEAHLPGTFYVHDTGYDDIASTHLATLTDQTGRKGSEEASKHNVEKYSENPNPFVQSFHEDARKMIGEPLSPRLLDYQKYYGKN